MKELFMLIIIGLISLYSTSINTVSFSGITFKIPKNWKTTEKEVDKNGIISISSEKKGWDASGVIMLTAFKGEGDQKEVLNIFSKNFRNTSIYALSNIQFSTISSTTLGKYNSYVAPYTVSFLGIQHRGSIYNIKQNGKFFIIVLQEALEDEEKNAEGFKLFKESLTLE